MFLLIGLCDFLCHEDVLGCLQVGQLTESLIMEVTESHVILEVYLIQQLLSDELLLKSMSLILHVEHFIRFFWSEVRFVVESLDLVGMRLSISIALNLLGKESQILHIVLLLKFGLVHSDHVLFLFLPVELFAFEFTRILDLLAFFLESLVSKVIDFLNIVNVLFSFMLGMVINLEWTL